MRKDSPRLFDVHTHIQFAAFSDDGKEAISRALRARVWIINVGTQRDTSARAVEISKEYAEGVYATVGLHPIHTETSYHDSKELGDSEEARGFTSRGEAFDYEYYVGLARSQKVVGIGECGLDYYRLGEDTKNKQAAVFLEHIRLAKEVGKPLMIHCRNAFSDLIEILSREKASLSEPRGVIHFFSGSVDDARSLLELGFSFSFGGVITFTRDYDEVLRFIPTERIVLETDAPYVAPVPFRGKRNEPLYIEHTAEALAKIKGISVESVSEETTKNALRIFGLEQ